MLRHVLKVAQENKWYHWISELKLHLIEPFYCFWSHLKADLFLPDLDLTFSLAWCLTPVNFDL